MINPYADVDRINALLRPIDPSVSCYYRINALLRPIDPSVSCYWSCGSGAYQFRFKLLNRWIGIRICTEELNHPNGQHFLLCRLIDALYNNGFANIAARLARGEILEPESDLSDFEQLRQYRQLWQFIRQPDGALSAIFGDRNQQIRLPLEDFSFGRSGSTWRIAFSTRSAQIDIYRDGKVCISNDSGRFILSGLMLNFYQESSSDGPTLTRVEIEPDVADARQTAEQIDVSTMSSADLFIRTRETAIFEVFSEPPRIEQPSWNYGPMVVRRFLSDEDVAALMPFWQLASEPEQRRLIDTGALRDSWRNPYERLQPEQPKETAIPDQCLNYQNLYGKREGGNLLICGMHPYGYEIEGEQCPDFEAQ